MISKQIIFHYSRDGVNVNFSFLEDHKILQNLKTFVKILDEAREDVLVKISETEKK